MSDASAAPLATLLPPGSIGALGGVLPPTHGRTLPLDPVRSMRTVDKGHGRIGTRQLAVSRGCVAHPGWPGAAQLCRIERTCAGKASREVAHAVTSLSPERADPDVLLDLWRDHRLIENRLHWRRDVTLRGDHSRVRSGTGPHAMAILRNTLLNVVRDAAEPLAENRLEAIAAAVKGFLSMGL